MLAKRYFPIHSLFTLILALLISVSGPCLYANESLTTQARNLDFSIKFASLILKTGEKINRDLAGRTLDEIEAPQMEKIIRSHMDEFVDLVTKEAELSSKNRSLIRKYMSKLEANKLLDIIKNSRVGLQIFFKKNGIGITVAMGIGQVVNYALIYMSYLIGQPQLIPIVQLIPFSWAFAVIPGSLEVIQRRNNLIKILGGKNQYLAYQLQMKQTLKKIKNEKNLLVPLTREEALIVDKLDWKAKYLSSLGLSPNDLNLKTLKKFLKEHEIRDSYTSNLLMNINIDNEIKTALIATHILESESHDITLQFKSHFSDNFIKTKNISNWYEIKKWTLNILEETNQSTIRKKMYQIPLNTPPEVIFEVWEKILIPHVATMSSVKYSEFRSFKKEMELLKAWSYRQNSMHWNTTYAKRFDQILKKTLRIFPEKCRHPEGQALNLVLNKS